VELLCWLSPSSHPAIMTTFDESPLRSGELWCRIVGVLMQRGYRKRVGNGRENIVGAICLHHAQMYLTRRCGSVCEDGKSESFRGMLFRSLGTAYNPRIFLGQASPQFHHKLGIRGPRPGAPQPGQAAHSNRRVRPDELAPHFFLLIHQPLPYPHSAQRQNCPHHS